MPDVFDDAEQSFDVFDQISDTPAVPTQPTTKLETFGREFTASLAPTAGAALGGAGGFAAGTAAAPSLGPLAPAAPFVGSFVGSLAGGAATDVAQREILERASPETLAKLEQGRAEHPLVAFGARMAAAVPIFTIAPGQTIRGLASLPAVLRQTASTAQKEAARAAAIQLGTGTAAGVAAPLIHGEAPTVGGITEAAIQAATFGRPRFQRPIAPTPPLPRAAPRVTVEPTAEVQPITEASRLLRRPEPTVVEAEPIPSRQTPATTEDIPLGVMRPETVDPSLRKLSEIEFDALYKKTTAEVDRLEKLHDEGKLQSRQALATAQDAYASADLERFRRNITDIVPEDLFRNLRREPNDNRARLILEELKRQGATPEQMLASMRMLSPDEAEVFRAQLERIKSLAETPSSEAEGPILVPPVTSEPPALIEPIRQQAPPSPPAQIEGAQPRAQIEGPSARKGGIIESYSTPMIERLDAVGGPESRRVATEARQIDSRSAELAGSVSQVVDTARTLASKLARGGTTWIRGTVQVTPKTFIGRLHGLEGLDRQVVVNSVPPVAQEMVGAIWDANVPAIGGLAAQANVGFAPQGKIQRILTAEGMDVLRSGKSNPVRNEWIKGTAVASNMPEPAIRKIWDDFKAELDKPTPDTARLDAIAQDFQRNIPRMVTHVRVGPRKVELIESDPVNYLNKATERTARAAAFREVYPNTPAGKQRLATTREAVQKELDTSLYPNEFDNLIKVLQGHQLDVSPGQAARLGSTSGLLVRRTARVIAQPMRAGMLSLSALANAAETLVGGPAAFLGFKNVLRVLTKNPIRYRKQLEMAGDLNAVTRNVAFNPNSPIESLSRILSEGVNRLTLNRFLNEAQEYTGAAASRILSDRVRARDLTPGEVKDFESTLRAAGFRDTFEAIAAGRDAQGLAQFERKAAPFLSAGYERPPIVSRWANSRAFNSLMWFHRYPQMVANQLRGILNNIIEDVRPETRSGARLYRDAKLLVKFLGVKTAQGILANYIIALIKEGPEGVKQQTREAKEAPGAFVAQALLTALGGPFTIAMRFGQRVETGEQAGLEALKLSAPISAAMDSVNAFAGTGRYQGLDPFDRATQFIESKTPAAPVAKSMLAITGLAHDKPQMRTARNAFYRWARSQGWKFDQAGQAKDAKFNAGMKRVVREMDRGADWEKTLDAVLTAKETGDPLKSAAQSLQHRKILKNESGGQLTDEELDSLQRWMGEENFNLLLDRDAMIEELAKSLTIGKSK